VFLAADVDERKAQMENFLLRWLQGWYARWCDEDWEHTYGVEIGTLDNPGWRVKIDLLGTGFEDQPFTDIHQEVDEDNWVVCRVRNNVFEGAGGAAQPGTNP